MLLPLGSVEDLKNVRNNYSGNVFNFSHFT